MSAANPAWNRLPKACVKGVELKGKLLNWLRYHAWHYLWSGRRYGLQFHDQCFEPALEVKEALRRLNLKEPWVYDQRLARLSRLSTLLLEQKRLPREQWTQWDDETFYLKPYLAEIEREKLDRRHSSALKPDYEVRLEGRPTGSP